MSLFGKTLHTNRSPKMFENKYVNLLQTRLISLSIYQQQEKCGPSMMSAWKDPLDKPKGSLQRGVYGGISSGKTHQN